jgi:hypothetical protein
MPRLTNHKEKAYIYEKNKDDIRGRYEAGPSKKLQAMRTT